MNQRLGGMPESTWDGLADRNFYSSAAWLGFCATDFGRESGAAVCHRDGEPVCAVPYVTADSSLFTSYHWHDLLTAAGLPAPAPDGLLVGPREGYQTHFLGAAQATPTELADVVEQLRTAAAEADPAGHTCVAMYVGTEDVLALQRAGITTTPVLLEPDAWIELPEGGLPAWQASLSRNRRSTVRGDLRRFRDAGFRSEHRLVTECWDKLGALASANQAKYGHSTSADLELKSLRNHALCMGEAARTSLLYAPDGGLAGFCLHYVWHDTVTLRWSGFDYDRLSDAREYFNLCYYSNIERADELGIRWLHAGVWSTDAKARRGAWLRPLWLLDLTENSALAGADEAIRAHNASRYAELKANPITAESLDELGWKPFL
jgi:hypothetical protein